MARVFYLYLGTHSLLIGIFPFFLPVYLWKLGYDLDTLSIFIALAGLGFCVGLWGWDRLRVRIDLTSMIALSLLLELILLFNVHILLNTGIDISLVAWLGLCYGIYNCVFWTTQRALFFEVIEPENSGRKYGNFQMFVGALLQVGILLGGLLIEKFGFTHIIVLSAIIAIIGFILVMAQKPQYPALLSKTKAVSLYQAIRFKDKDRSKTFFILDGIYLFLESFFWIVSLFLIAHESFTKLGIIILSLAVIFAVLFYLLKNTIDRLGKKRVYQVAVLLYMISWALRALVDQHTSLELLYIGLVLIIFNTTLFRLAVNKRFYDIAKHQLGHHYLVLKSYYSQATIFIAFLLFGCALFYFDNDIDVLKPMYWMASGGAVVYLLYGSKLYDASLSANN